MLRSNTYDLLPQTVKSIKETLSARRSCISDTLEKADISTDFATFKRTISRADKVLDLFNDDIDVLCKSARSQFLDLQSDFRKGNINEARYKKYLKDLNSLLTESGEKVSNKNLGANEIALELKKYL